MNVFSWDEKLDRILHQQEWMIKALQIIHGKEIKIMATLEDLVADVAEEETVGDSVVTLLHGIKTQLDDVLKNAKLTPGQQAQVDAVFSKMESNKAKLAQAVIDNTDAAPTDTTVGGGGTDTTAGGTVPAG